MKKVTMIFALLSFVVFVNAQGTQANTAPSTRTNRAVPVVQANAPVAGSRTTTTTTAVNAAENQHDPSRACCQKAMKDGKACCENGGNKAACDKKTAGEVKACCKKEGTTATGCSHNHGAEERKAD